MSAAPSAPTTSALAQPPLRNGSQAGVFLPMPRVTATRSLLRCADVSETIASSPVWLTAVPSSSSSSSRAVRIARTVPIYLFVNTKSGGRLGSKFMRIPQPFEVEVSPGVTACLRLYDIFEGDSGDKPGFVQLKEAARLGSVRMVVAGGDGSVLWAIEEAAKHGIDARNEVMLAVLPLGTGNDFSRFCGWGGKPPNIRSLTQPPFSALRALVCEWTTSRAHAHDVWRVTMEVDPVRGAILKTGHERKKVPIDAKRTEKLMHSYFSAGNDARAGMGQEKARTTSRLGNFVHYVFQGCLKSLPFRDKEYVKDFALSMHHGEDDEAPVIFSTDEDDTTQPRLVDDPLFLMVLNIPNCYGGLCRFWDGAGSVGVHPVADKNLLSAELDPSDGKLEVLTCGGLIKDIALNITTQAGLPAHRFNGKRIFSGGPLFLQFVEDDQENVYVHMQIDGEYLKLQNPLSVSFVLDRQIKVLYGGHQASSAASGDSDSETDTIASNSSMPTDATDESA